MRDCSGAARRRARVARVQAAVARRSRSRRSCSPRCTSRRWASVSERSSTRTRASVQRAHATSTSSRPGLLVASCVQLAATESMWPVLAGVKWIRFYDGVVATPIEPGELFGGFVVWTAIRAMLGATAFLRRRGAARRRAVGVGRARDPGRRAVRRRVRGADRRVLDQPGDRPRVPDDHAARHPAAVLVLGDVLPDQRAARARCNRSRRCRRCGTASSSHAPRRPASSTSGPTSRTSRSSSRASPRARVWGVRALHEAVAAHEPA